MAQLKAAIASHISNMTPSQGNMQDKTTNVTIDPTLLHAGSQWRAKRATDQIEERLRRSERAQTRNGPKQGKQAVAPVWVEIKQRTPSV